MDRQSAATIADAELTVRLLWRRYVITSALLGCLIILGAISFAHAWVAEMGSASLLWLQTAAIVLVAVYPALATQRRWRLLHKARLVARLGERRQMRERQNYEA